MTIPPDILAEAREVHSARVAEEALMSDTADSPTTLTPTTQTRNP